MSKPAQAAYSRYVIEHGATLARPAEPPAKRRHTYEELVAELPETNCPCELWDGELIISPTPSFYHQDIEQYGIREYWLIDPEARTAEVLFLEGGKYELVMRAIPGQVAASKLLPGFEVQVEALFRPE